MKIKVNISKRHMRDGKPLDACNCAAALGTIDALKDARINFQGVVVGLTYTNIRFMDGSMESIKNPKKLQKFIDRYDRGKSTKPLSYSLKV